MLIISKELQINEDIRDKEIRLIDSDGSQVGVISARDAQKMANEQKLDLVKISPNAQPPVCKIMDYGKYKYELQKKDKEAKKKQKIVTMKEIRLSPNIEEHDLQVKANNANKFLKHGDKVKVTLRFRGREMGYIKLGYEAMDKFKVLVEELGAIEKKPTLEGRNMHMIIVPKTK